jgi:glycosyltransferase involved in cell wall biosynthesis
MLAPTSAVIGFRAEAFPPATFWLPAAVSAIRRHLSQGGYAVVLATSPPAVAMLAARVALRASDRPFVAEFRDLWAGNPAFDAGGRTLNRVESWVLGRASAIVACTPPAVADLRQRHPGQADRIFEIPNGFEPELLEQRAAGGSGEARTVLIHSGTIGADRPIAPLLEALREEQFTRRFRLVLHGHIAPSVLPEIRRLSGQVDVDVAEPSSWAEAIERIRAADVGVVLQGRDAGDSTAVASKVYEYLALGKPVLSITDGGATEGALRRLGHDRFVARLGDPASIRTALERLTSEPRDVPEAEALAPFSRRSVAARMAELLDDVSDAHRRAGGRDELSSAAPD